LFYNVNDYKKHEEKLREIQNYIKEDDDAYKIVIEAVHNEFNVEYPMIKEISFRESVDFSYTIRQVNQIYIQKGENAETKFISNEEIKKELNANRGKEKNVLKQYHCYRMIDFYTPGLANFYFKKRSPNEQYCYILNYKNIRIDGLNGNEFMEREFKAKLDKSKTKMEKKERDKKNKKKVIYIFT
jgi:hypothetical protein